MRVGTLLTAVVVLMTVAVAFLPFQARAQTAQDTLIVGRQNNTVYVRPGVTFTDGDPMDADDVVFTFQVMSFNSQLSDSLLASIVWDGTDWPRWKAPTGWGAANPTPA